METGITLVELLEMGRITQNGEPLPDGIHRRIIRERGDRIRILPREVRLSFEETPRSAELYPDRQLLELDVNLGYSDSKEEDILEHERRDGVLLRLGAPDMRYEFYVLHFAPKGAASGSVEARQRRHEVLTFRY